MITNSLAVKNALVYLLLFVVGIGMLGLILLKYSSSEIIKGTEAQLSHQSQLVNIKLLEEIQYLTKDLDFISNSSVFSDYIADKSPENANRLEKEFSALIKAKPNYYQIRFLSIEGPGKELIRVERRNDELLILSGDQLQIKGNRSYYLNTINLPKDSIYISPIDLNKEFGQISKPVTPTLRAGFPVYHDDKSIGIVIINYDLRDLYSSLEKVIDKNYNIRIADNRGYYILHESPDSTFLFEFGGQPQITHEFKSTPIALLNQSPKIFKHNHQIFNIEKLILPGTSYELLLFSFISENELFQTYYKWRNNSFYLILSLGLIFMFIAYQVLKRQSSNLKSITNKIKSFPKTLKVSDLPINRKDEIGQLSLGIEEMSNKLNATLKNLKEAKDIAEKAAKEKQEFLENFSHEIRNPLQSIAGITKVLEDNSKQPELKGIINNLKFNTANLNLLLNDILDYKQVTENNITLQPEWISLSYFLEELYKSNQYFALTKKIEFTLYIDPELRSKEIFIDKIRLGQILNNLITNALKYTPKDGSVSIIINRSNATLSSLHFSIKDTGPGITNQSIVVERYHKDSKNKNHPDSHGIGLSIVTNLLKIMGSELNIITNVGKGSDFSFNIDLPIREASQISSIKDDNKNINFLNSTILIIEDDHQIIDLYKYIFENKNVQLHIATNYNEVNSLNQKFDIIIADYKIGSYSITDLHEKINTLLHNQSLFYLASAIKIDKDVLPFLIVPSKIFDKPFDINEMVNSIFSDYCKLSFEDPDFTSIKKDYDFQKEKYVKAITILLVEWKAIKPKLIDALKTTNLALFDEISHKIITSIRRLKLEKFENFIQHIDIKDLQKTSFNIQKLEIALDHYIYKIESFLNQET